MLDMTFAPAIQTSETARTLPRSGISAGTLVLTLHGAVPVETLVTGDKVITRAGARSIVAVEITTMHNASAIRICEGVLGKKRPEADLFVAPGQPILIRDWRAKAIVGLDQAVMTAERLADGAYIKAETVADLRLVSLRFATEQVIYAAGLEVGCEGAISA